MRIIDADALSAFVGDLRSTLHKEQSKFKGMTDIEFNTRDYMLLNFQYAIDNAPTVERPQGEFTIDELKKWLYQIAFNNTDNDFGEYCEEIIGRLDGFERFVTDMRKETENE